ncbi:hypothetical protein [Chondrinema litorale]|uniref:hypothetical protein n=1 Tax=Chondrinema litorale TaxID=2994555 RepID=UPI002543A287|nr:hypothetical protein [Chondrinema litorale]UZR96497.1 hypothetical protein OQ292_22835 [Chondrinema litorale]
MTLPAISVINFTTHILDQEVLEVINAINKQIKEHFMPIWGSGKILKFHPTSYYPTDSKALVYDPVRTENVVYLVEESTLSSVLGYHSLNASELPFGFVFTENEDWSVNLSNEVLELIIDPLANIFLPGPDPFNHLKTVFHAYRSCCAVDQTNYTIEGVSVSNFVTPAYFSIGDGPGIRTDFLGIGVSSFGAAEDSKISFFDLQTHKWDTYLGDQISTIPVMGKRENEFKRLQQTQISNERLSAILLKASSSYKNLQMVYAITREERYKKMINKILQI